MKKSVFQSLFICSSSFNLTLNKNWDQLNSSKCYVDILLTSHAIECIKNIFWYLKIKSKNNLVLKWTYQKKNMMRKKWCEKVINEKACTSEFSQI